MALIFSDPNTAGPFQTFQVKDVECRVHQLPFSYFSTTGVNTLLGSYPPDTAFLGFDVWVGTVLSGNGVTAPTATLGSASAGTQFSNAVAVTNSAGYTAKLTPVTGILQAHDPTNRTDINLWFKGSCSTGNPTAGTIYLVVYYVR